MIRMLHQFMPNKCPFRSESCQTAIENAKCYPTTTNVDMYYKGSDTSEFRQSLLNALYAADLEALLAEAGVLEVGGDVDVSDDDDDVGAVVVGQRAADGLSGGAIAGIAMAGIATVLVLLFLLAARNRSPGSMDGQVKHVYLDEGDDGMEGTYSPRGAHIVGEDSSHSSGWSGYSPDRTGNNDHILQYLNDFEDDNHCMGVELGLDGKARDVHRCASATCETCRQKRLRPMFIRGGDPPQPPPRLPLDARRVYTANDTVDL